MLLRRVALVLSLSALLSACSLEGWEKPAELGAEIILTKISSDQTATAFWQDLRRSGGPYKILTPIPTLTPAPTLTPTPAYDISIYTYFNLITSSGVSCQTAAPDDQDEKAVLKCTDENTGINVWYYAWSSRSGMDTYVQRQLNSLNDPTAQISISPSWFEDQKVQGSFYEFLDNQGISNIIWTVNDSNLLGWAVGPDGDQASLHTWWSDTGAQHY